MAENLDGSASSVPAGARRSCAIIAFRLMLGRLPVEQEDERRRRGQTLAQANDQDPADLADGEVCGIGHCHHSPSLIGLATAGQTYVFRHAITDCP